MYQYIIPQFTVWLCRVVDTVMRAGGFKMGKFALGLASLAMAAKPKYDIAGNSRSRLMISQAVAMLRGGNWTFVEDKWLLMPWETVSAIGGCSCASHMTAPQ